MSKLPVRRDGPPPEFAVFRPPPPPQPPADRERELFYKRAAWRRCRALKLARDPLCEACLRSGVARPEPATQVHHAVDLAVRPDLAYDLANLEALCQRHHSSETMRRNRLRNVDLATPLTKGR